MGPAAANDYFYVLSSFAQGTLIFEKDANFTSNDARTIDSTMRGQGGAISNAASGSITFQAALIMESNVADVS